MNSDKENSVFQHINEVLWLKCGDIIVCCCHLVLVDGNYTKVNLGDYFHCDLKEIEILMNFQM